MARHLLCLTLVVVCPSLVTAQTICLDPGHPSETSAGTRGRHSTEMQVNWDLSQRVARFLEERGAHVVLTKQREGELVTNKRRAEIANAAHADLMLRLHCDAGAGTGFAVYYPTRKGLVHSYQGPSESTLAATTPIAFIFHAVLAHDLKGALKDNGLLSDARTAIGAKQGALTSSIYSRVPVVLVEIAVLTNQKDEDFITSNRGMNIAASALADAALKAIAPSLKDRRNIDLR